MMFYSFTYLQIFVKTFWIYDQEICVSNANYILKPLQFQFWSYVEANIKLGDVLCYNSVLKAFTVFIHGQFYA